MGTNAKRGRPAGLLLNHVAAQYVLGDRSQSWWATEADVSPGHLSSMLAGRKAATREMANRLADAVDCPVGVLFPELVSFTSTIRHFTAPDRDAE